MEVVNRTYSGPEIHMVFHTDEFDNSNSSV